MLWVGNYDDDNSQGRLNGSVVSNNKILCPAYFGNDPGGQHAMFCFAQNMTFKYNYVNGSFLGLVVKHKGLAYVTNALYNIFIDCDSALTIKGAPGTLMYGNTIVQNTRAGTMLQLVEDAETDPDTYSINCDFKNNICASYGSLDSDYIATDANNIAGLDSDYNVFYKAYSGNDPFIYESPARKDFADWKADLTQDINSYESDPLLQDETDPNTCYPTGVSDAIGNGSDVGAAYDDGLDTATDFDDSDEDGLAVVVTKQQGVNWDIGAYIS